MGLRLKPSDEAFYQYISELTAIVRESADLLFEAMNEPANVEELFTKVDVLEKDADKITDKIISRLNDTFITPLDREDIYALAQKIDDVIDGVQGIAERMTLYNAGAASAGAIELASLVVKSARQLEKACSYLPDMKKKRLKLEARCARIVDTESKGDRLYRQEMAKLFRECKDPIELIKWKEILMLLEDALDDCEGVADLLKGVLLKYA
ncbi:uncharacterized protein Yka (UPF0111/DUF47 family) [Sporomusaceae bacterium BoRhaA]|uniref:DUF47 domain-containing protein n=1 Tax=Pelorhabdus rhamnosifermentans TaxID=2772457 RepID=UPI001C0601CA|nr:DUF47 family protein [Pelorhabdus rhamnosifermentans]MBU2703290.1 uncharacterized protein Yka (UPF0111/DUF47 family) [Pelorhabdus rhamnosifermentans]